MRALTAAFFLVLFSSFASGGEWHSAGNAPRPPYRPSKPANYKCLMTAYTTVGAKTYRIDSGRIVRDEEFREPNGTAVTHTLENTGDPGMDGQSFTLAFEPGQNEEAVRLIVVLRAEGKASSHTRVSAPRSQREVRASADLTVEKPKKGGVSSVSATVECRELFQ
jgi:hypothetical protein